MPSSTMTATKPRPPFWRSRVLPYWLPLLWIELLYEVPIEQDVFTCIFKPRRPNQSSLFSETLQSPRRPYYRGPHVGCNTVQLRLPNRSRVFVSSKSFKNVAEWLSNRCMRYPMVTTSGLSALCTLYSIFYQKAPHRPPAPWQLQSSYYPYSLFYHIMGDRNSIGKSPPRLELDMLSTLR
jgi:hypothetical protein